MSYPAWQYGVRKLLPRARSVPSGYEQRRIVVTFGSHSERVEPITMQFFSFPGVPSQSFTQSYATLLSDWLTHESYSTNPFPVMQKQHSLILHLHWDDLAKTHLSHFGVPHWRLLPILLLFCMVMQIVHKPLKVLDDTVMQYDLWHFEFLPNTAAPIKKNHY